jgi:hypothetical protein
MHTAARELITLYHNGKEEEAREGLSTINDIAEELVALLTSIENKLIQ